MKIESTELYKVPLTGKQADELLELIVEKSKTGHQGTVSDALAEVAHGLNSVRRKYSDADILKLSI